MCAVFGCNRFNTEKLCCDATIKRQADTVAPIPLYIVLMLLEFILKGDWYDNLVFIMSNK
jgi:hypothetical protein